MATSVVILVGVIVSILIHQLNNTDVFIYLGYGFHVVVAVADASPKPNTGLDQLLCAVQLPVKVRSLGGEWRAEPNLPLLLLVKSLSVLHQMRPLLQAAAAGYAAVDEGERQPLQHYGAVSLLYGILDIPEHQSGMLIA